MLKQTSLLFAVLLVQASAVRPVRFRFRSRAGGKAKVGNLCPNGVCKKSAVACSAVCASAALTQDQKTKLAKLKAKLPHATGACSAAPVALPSNNPSGSQKPQFMAKVKGFPGVWGMNQLGYSGGNKAKEAKYLEGNNFKGMLSYQQPSFTSEKACLATNAPSIVYTEDEVEDYQPPSVEALNKMITMVGGTAWGASKQMAMHCTAGCGRTGFMVAALLSAKNEEHICTAIDKLTKCYAMPSHEECIENCQLLERRVDIWKQWVAAQ